MECSLSAQLTVHHAHNGVKKSPLATKPTTLPASENGSCLPAPALSPQPRLPRRLDQPNPAARRPAGAVTAAACMFISAVDFFSAVLFGGELRGDFPSRLRPDLFGQIDPFAPGPSACYILRL